MIYLKHLIISIDKEKNRMYQQFDTSLIFFSLLSELFTETKSFNDCAVTLNVLVLEIVQQTATPTYKLNKSSVCAIIFMIGLNMFGQTVDTV